MRIKMSKAVEILELNVKEAGKKMPPDVLAAVNLGVSTMKAVLLVRHGGSWDAHALLPDELPES
jgi:hypothetical protein